MTDYLDKVYLGQMLTSKLDLRIARLHDLANSRIRNCQRLAEFEGQEGNPHQELIHSRLSELLETRETLLRLVQNEFIADPQKKRFCEYAASVLRPGVNLEDFFHIQKDEWRYPFTPDPVVKEVMESLASGRQSAMQQEVIYRASCAADYANRHNWFVIMDTLTLENHYRVDPAQVLSTEGWRNYKERFTHHIGMAVYGSKTKYRRARRTDFIGYVGCVEHGDDGDNPHIHVLWFCKNVPESWKMDPNSGFAIPKRREIDAAKDLWEYGYSTPTCVRTDDFDAWGRCGHVWPVDKKKGTPIPRLGATGAGMYIAKYLNKEQQRQWSTRVRISRNLGMMKAQEFLRRVPTRCLRPLTKCSMLSFKNWPNVPVRVVKKLARKERLKRCLPRLALVCKLSQRKRSLNLVGLLNDLVASLRKNEERFSELCAVERPPVESEFCDVLAMDLVTRLTLAAGSYKRREEARLRLEMVPEIKFNPMNGFTGYAYV